MKLLGQEWAVTPIPGTGNFQLSNGTRTLLVTDAGVHECSRDGKAMPLELIDCGPTRKQLITERLAAESQTAK